MHFCIVFLIHLPTITKIQWTLLRLIPCHWFADHKLHIEYTKYIQKRRATLTSLEWYENNFTFAFERLTTAMQTNIFSDKQLASAKKPHSV